MNENWQGLHRRAAARLESLAAEPRADPEALKALAFARYWSGDPERARRTLEDYLAIAPADHEALDLRRRIEGERRPSLTGDYTRSRDSDRLRVETTSMELRLPLLRRSTLEAGGQRDDVRDDGGRFRAVRLRAGVVTGWSAVWTTRAYVGWARPEDGAAATLVGELSLTWRPEDRLRVDAGVSREPVLTRLALASRISASTWVLGADWKATERLTVRAVARQRLYSDDNHAHPEALSAAYRAVSSHRGSVTATFGVEQLHTRRDLDHGYYDPPGYAEWGPGVEVGWTPREGLTVSGDARLWSQRERGGRSETSFNSSARAEWTVAHALAIALHGGRSNSNLATAAGYERRHWGLSVARGF